MAKDDYFVIAYQILAYLYNCLKNGQDIDIGMLKPESPLLGINVRYWAYIMQNLQEQGFIRGLVITRPFGKEIIIDNLDECEITPDGIAYLCDNSFLEKAKQFLKDVKAITPFF